MTNPANVCGQSTRWAGGTRLAPPGRGSGRLFRAESRQLVDGGRVVVRAETRIPPDTCWLGHLLGDLFGVPEVSAARHTGADGLIIWAYIRPSEVDGLA